MIGRLLLLLATGFVFSAPVSGQAILQDVLSSKAGETGWLHIFSLRPITKIWLDSLELPVFEPPLFKVEAGKHRLLVRLGDPELWNSRDWQDSVEVVGGDTTTIKVEDQTYLTLQTEPFGSDVFLDSIKLGTTPIPLLPGHFTTGRILLRKAGFCDTTLIGLPAQTVRLRPDPAWQALLKEQEQRKIMQSKKRKHCLGITLSAAISSGIAALILKSEANKSYDHYLQTGHPAEMKKWFDKSLRYDRAAAMAYLVFELNLIASAYLVFKTLVSSP